jgi:hypothetical protein
VGLGREDMRRGDWMCSECGTHNFSNKTQCRTCDVPRAQGDPNFGASKALPARDVARLRVRMLPYIMSKLEQGVCFNKCAFKVCHT